ncbi:sensor domain-containing protein [Aquibacillus kalidii]|uniref:sensor domain-containing protein n=1 Tax=Aquibacillus kalidii TaxID=2762597 RepID=UPI0016491119|nr:diguanylate cyclase [Aquibacillus kalidii]
MFAKIKNLKNLDLIFNSISDMVFLMEINDKGYLQFATANKNATDSLHLPKGFEGKTVEELMPTLSAENFHSKYKEAIESKEVIIYEEKMEFPVASNLTEKRLGWVEFKITPVFNDNDESEYLIVVLSEITDRKAKEQELKQLKEQFELIYNHAGDPIFTFDSNGKYISVNPSFTELFGWTEEELMSNRNKSILPITNKSEFAEILSQLQRGEVIKNHYAERMTRTGEIIHVLSSYTPIMKEGKFTRCIAVYKDITHIDQLREALRESESKYRIIVENSNDLIRIINKEGQIEYASPSHYSILGLDPSFFIGKSYLSFVHREDMARLHYFVEKMYDTDKLVDGIEYRRLNKNGEIIWVHTRGGVIQNAKGEVDKLIFVSREISDIKERETELRTMALYDELTGLPTRTLFNENLDVAMNITKRSGKITALLLLDCDNFKGINDTYGHDVGDEVIKQFANRIQLSVRTIDTVSRMGGDEFQVVLPDLQGEADAINICQTIVNRMADPIVFGEHTISISTSIGISYYLGKDKTKEQIVKEADKALYVSKEKGKNTYSEYTEEETKPKKIKIFNRLFKKE